MMIRKPYITALLLLLSILMLAVPVIPHHHHGSEAICLKNDLHIDCDKTNHHHHPAGHPNCCHDKGCLTHQFVQRTPRVERQTSQSQPVLQPADLNLLVSLLCSYTDSHSTALYSTYIESLFGVYIARASGLRAPPSLLA